MGVIADKDGISVHLYNDDGSPKGAPLYCRHAKLFARQTAAIIANGPTQTPNEKQYQGSGDWITLVAVADTQERLTQILREPDLKDLQSNSDPEPLTSCASRRVFVEINMAGLRHRFRNCITIASGALLKPTSDPNGPLVEVVHVKVLPEGAGMHSGHPLEREFLAQSVLRKMRPA